MDIVTQIKQELEAFNKKKVELVEQLKTEFPKLIQPLLKKSEKIKSIGWTQYTPYFNDGDSCTFSVNLDLIINGKNEDEEDEDEDVEIDLRKAVYKEITEDNIQEHKEFNNSSEGYSWYISKTVGQEGYFPNPNYNTFEASIIDDIRSVLGSIPDEFYPDLFGDHVEVTVYKNGTINVEEYEHD